MDGGEGGGPECGGGEWATSPAESEGEVGYMVAEGEEGGGPYSSRESQHLAGHMDDRGWWRWVVKREAGVSRPHWQ
jgi:hypothetical protein